MKKDSKLEGQIFVSSSIEPIFISTIVISALAAFTDLWRGKVYNWLTFPAIFLGIFLSTFYFGWSGFVSSLFGVILAFFIFGWMFLIQTMGAGDVKLLMALGALGGARYSFEVAILSVLIGAAFAFVILSFKGQIFSFAKKMYRFLLSIFIKELVVELPSFNRDMKMPFAVPIAIAAIWTLYSTPLEKFMWVMR